MTTKLEILNHTSVQVTEHTYIFQDDTGRFFYKEWLDDRGRVIDSVLRDKDGFEIDDPELLARVCDLLDEMDSK